MKGLCESVPAEGPPYIIEIEIFSNEVRKRVFSCEGIGFSVEPGNG